MLINSHFTKLHATGFPLHTHFSSWNFSPSFFHCLLFVSSSSPALQFIFSFSLHFHLQQFFHLIYKFYTSIYTKCPYFIFSSSSPIVDIPLQTRPHLFPLYSFFFVPPLPPSISPSWDFFLPHLPSILLCLSQQWQTIWPHPGILMASSQTMGLWETKSSDWLTTLCSSYSITTMLEWLFPERRHLVLMSYSSQLGMNRVSISAHVLPFSSVYGLHLRKTVVSRNGIWFWRTIFGLKCVWSDISDI